MRETPESKHLRMNLEGVEHRFERAGVPVTAWVGRDVRTGRTWLGVNDENGDEILRIAHNERYVSGVDAWTVYDDEFTPLTETLSKTSFGDAVKKAIEEARKLL